MYEQFDDVDNLDVKNAWTSEFTDMFGWSLKIMSLQEQLVHELVNLSVPKIHMKSYRLSKQFNFPYGIDVIRSPRRWSAVEFAC